MISKGSTINTEKPELIQLSDELHEIAAQLAGVESILAMISDTGSISGQVADAITLIGGFAERLNNEICAIADKVHEIGEVTA